MSKPTDTERLQWLLRYGYVKYLGGGAHDFDYVPVTLDLVDKAIARDAEKRTAVSPPPQGPKE